MRHYMSRHNVIHIKKSEAGMLDDGLRQCLKSATSRARSRTSFASALLLLVVPLYLLTALVVPRIAYAQKIPFEKYLFQGLNVQACVRHLNNTGIVGCQADLVRGVIYEISDDATLNRFDADTLSSEKYAVVMPVEYLTKTNIEKLRGTGKLAGILALKYPTPSPPSAPSLVGTAPASPDTTCPQCSSSPLRNTDVSTSSLSYQWNPPGTGILYESYDFPIFSMFALNEQNEASLEYVQQAAAHNRDRKYSDYPLYALEFDAFMWAGGNAERCLRASHDTDGQQRCDPIGGQSVWGSSDINMTTSTQTVVLAARLDSTAFFQDAAVGAWSSVSGIVTLLAAVDMMRNNAPDFFTTTNKLLPVFFNAQQYALAGSETFVRDLASAFTCSSTSPSGSCYGGENIGAFGGCTSPCRRRADFARIDLLKTQAVIELGQLLGAGRRGGVFLHAGATGTGIDDVASAFTSSATNPNMSATVAYNGSLSGLAVGTLPPGALHSYLARRPTLKHVSVQDFGSDGFANPYYSGDLDDGNVWNDTDTDGLCAVAELVAKGTYKLLRGDAAAALTGAANCTLVKDLMECMTRNVSCVLMQKSILSPWNVPKVTSGVRHETHFSGVYSPYAGLYAEFVNRMLSYLLTPDGVEAVNKTNNGARLSGPIECSVPTDCVGVSTWGINGREVPTACVLGRCVGALVSYHDALPPGMERNEAAGTVVVRNWSEPIWTESRWRDIACRLYMVQSDTTLKVELAIGGGVALVSIILSYLASFVVQKSTL